jgi:hypothetical protein
MGALPPRLQAQAFSRLPASRRYPPALCAVGAYVEEHLDAGPTMEQAAAVRDISLAEIAACAGFSDLSQFSHPFKRVVGVTPRQFRRSARIA